MECLDVIELLSAFVDEALDQRTADAVRSHISQCTSCAKELQMMRSVVQAAREIEFVDPPRELSQRIMSAVQIERIEAEHIEKMAQLVSAYVDGELAVEEAAALEAHAANCARCAQEISALRSLAETVGALGFEEPPQGLKERIAAATSRRAESIWQTAAHAIARGLVSRPAKVCYAAALSGLVAFALVRLPYQSTTSVSSRISHGSNQVSTRQEASGVVSSEKRMQYAAPQVASAKNDLPGHTTAVRGTHATVRIAKRYSDAHQVASVAKSKTLVRFSDSNKPKATSESASTENDALAGSADTAAATVETEPAEAKVAAAEQSAPPAGDADNKSDEVRVASVPLVDPQKIEEMIREIKSEAGVRRGSDRAVSISILRSRF